jgi:fructuronate reductase
VASLPLDRAGPPAMRLNNATLETVPPTVQRPSYARADLHPGIVHLGVGAFMRAHLAVATEAATQATGDMRFGIVGVSLRRPDTHEALAPQDGLYTVSVRGADPAATALAPATVESLQVVGCLTSLRVGPQNPKAVLRAIASAHAHLVTLTITEKGYLSAPGTGAGTGALMADHADLAHDLLHATSPRTAVGFLVHGLALRQAQQRAPITVLSLDNLPSNGKRLRSLVLDFARRLGHVDRHFADWIDANATFPDSMVDRIVPRTTDADRTRVAQALGVHDAWPVVAEPFFDWVIEDHFAGPRPAWEHHPGVRLVHDVAPWEAIKLRMVNGSHSAIAYLGVLAGWMTVDEAMAQPAMHAYVNALMRDEIEPTLPTPEGFDATVYRASLLQRFANPALAHRTQHIAMDGSQKIPQRWFTTLRDRLRQTQDPQSVRHLALALAAWLCHLRGTSEAGVPFTIDDPLQRELRAHAQHIDAQPTAQARAIAALDLPAVFGEWSTSPPLKALLVDALSPALETLRTQGVKQALRL